MSKNPAFDLFDRMFDEEAADPGPVLPGYFVPTSVFIARARQEGITEVPENVISFWQWASKSGFRKHVEKRITDYHKEKGTERTPAEKGALRLLKKMGWK